MPLNELWIALRALGIGVIAVVALQQADSGIWWHLSMFRSIRLRCDTDRIYKSVKNTFFVPAKLLPALMVFCGVVLMDWRRPSPPGLILSLIGIVLFVIFSWIYAYAAVNRATDQQGLKPPQR